MYQNTKVRQSSVFSLHFSLKNLLIGNDIEIKCKHKPMPATHDIKGQTNVVGNFIIIFFLNVAFCIVPANYVTILIKENPNNTKHLMKLNFVNLLEWLSNYIFDLIKYYITGGICLLLIFAFNYYKNYLYILYLLYGPEIIAFTNLISFIFSSEAVGQNCVLLINFLFGALGSIIILCLKFQPFNNNIEKILSIFFDYFLLSVWVMDLTNY